MASKDFVRLVLWLPLMFSLDGAAVPVFVVEPEDTVATPVGRFRSATLHCQTSFQDTVPVTWYKDDVAVEKALLPSYNITNSSLVVTTTESQDDGMILEGFYYCVVSNHFGAAKSRSALVKTQGLVALFQPAASVFYPAETLVVAEIGYLQQPVSHSRTLWLVECGGKQFICTSVNCASWHHVSTAGRLLLYSILRLTYNDIKVVIPDCQTGTTVFVTGTLGYGSSPQRYQLTFEGLTFIPRRTILSVQEISAEIGTNTTLYCISNHPNSTYNWHQNGSLIMVDDDNRFSVIIDGVLQVRNVLERDGGQYDCSSTAIYPGNPNPVTRHTIINLSVYSVPSINMTLIQNDPRRTLCGTITSTSICNVYPNVSSVAIVCDCDGSGPLLIQILHNASVLFQLNVTDDQRSVQYNINIPSSGVYQCIATNPYGSKQISLCVLVQGPTSTVPTAAPSTSTPTTPARLPTPLSTKVPRSTTQTQYVPASTTTAPARLPPHLSTTAPRSTTQSQSVPASTSTAAAASTPASSTGDTPPPASAISTVSPSPPTATTVGSLRTTSISITSTSFSTNASSSTTTGTTTTTTTQSLGTVSSSCKAECQSAIGWKVAAAISWVFSAVLLSVVIVLIWLRHKEKKKYEVSLSKSRKNDEELVYNAAYTTWSPAQAVGNGMTGGEYEEVGQVQ